MHHGAFGRFDRQRRVRHDLARPRLRFVEQLVGRHHRVDDAHAERVLCVDRFAKQQHFHGPRERDLAREPHGGATAGEQSALGLEDAERRVLRRDPDVGPHQHLHAPGDARSVDCGDHRFPQLEVAKDGREADLRPDLLPFEHVLVHLLGVTGDGGHERLQVGADGEVFAGSGDDRDARALVVAKLFPRRCEVGHVRQVERVAALRPVDRDGGDPVFFGDLDGHVRPFA